MKITKLFTLALAAFAFAACSQDDSVTENMRKANITLHAPEFDADWSRAQGSAPGKGFRIKHTLNETTGMEFSWTQGDIAGVFAEKGGQLDLKMIEGQDAAAKVYFDRQGYLLEEGKNYVAYYPLVDKVTQTPNIEVSYLNQEQDGNHSYDHLAKYDYMVSDPVTVQQTNTADFMFNHQGAILRLLIDDLPEGTYSSVKLFANKEDGTTPVSAFTTKAVLNLFDKTEVIQAAATSNAMKLTFKENITITESDNQLEAWLMVSPVDFTTNKLTVTVYDANNKEAVSYTINPGKKFEKGKAYQIKLPGDAVDHSKNPLLKWAETNLVRKAGTSGKNVENEFASSYTEIGSYYQFGRNHGYASYSDVTQYAIESTNIPSNRNVYTGKRSTATVPKYNASLALNAYPQYFFIDPNHNGDYVVVNGSTKSQTWSERAAFNGYTTSDPSPEGWRLPTLKDYKEILPQGGFDGLLTTLSEVKSLEDGTHYAIQWNRVVISNNNYLKIRCLVVPSSVTDASTVDWENDKNVVVRYFRAGGAIQASYHWWQFTYNGYSSNQYIACPLPLCAYNANVTQLTTTTATVVYTITRNDNNLCGLYWMSDAGQYAMTFRYDPNNYQQGSCVNVFGNALPNAYNIRCVRAE